MLRATTTFAVGHRVVRSGTIVADDDPVVAGRETLFEPVAPVVDDTPIEVATARPGTKRSTRRKD